MAMRVCVHCKADITYERTANNPLVNGVKGFWRDALQGQTVCPAAPDSIHDPGDVHTPPKDPSEIEKFLSGEYVPPPPSKPCGQMYGMSEEGDILECGLEKNHEGDCEAGAAYATEAEQPQQDAPRMVGVAMAEVSDTEVAINVEITDGPALTIQFDKTTVTPMEFETVLQAMGEVLSKQLVNIARERKPKPPEVLEDPTDIEKFLNGDE